VSNEWRITENIANVAAQFADRWATAVAAQARRIQRPENTLERVPDAWVQVSVLRQLLRAAQMAREATEAESAQRRIQEAIETFIDAIVVETTMADGARAFKLARDALEHFDEYYRGTGDEQQPRTRRRDRSPREDLAQTYRGELDGQADGALRLRIGPLRPAEPLVVIDLVEHAPRASSPERWALETEAGRRCRLRILREGDFAAANRGKSNRASNWHGLTVPCRARQRWRGRQPVTALVTRCAEDSETRILLADPAYSAPVDIGVLLDGSLGALVGAVITGGAQIWSFRVGNKTARTGLSLDAARQLLEVVHESKDTLRLLPYTDNAAGSPLSFTERFDRSRPMRDALNHAQFAVVPLLTDPEAGRRFNQFASYCEHVSGPYIGAQDIQSAVEAVMEYGDHARACLTAHINKTALPPEPHPDIPALS
jgi:hypothetical protein